MNSTVLRTLEDARFDSYNRLRNEVSDKSLELILEIFAFGDISDYYRHKQCLIELNDQQLMRIRQLTLLSLCRNRTEVSFEDISKRLMIPRDHVINYLVILGDSAVIRFRIDELEKKIDIEEICQSRDVYCSQDKPLEIVSIPSEQTVVRLIEELKRFRDERVKKVKKDISKEIKKTIKSGTGIKRPLES
ncbi:hypothetical protein FOA43_002246 [Brettanomyces nanus]|uniref:PCI domain-containing protein n=1 Tax=Eeniella nana TaxID=13502 RepID=A0A875S1T5_EENNA|nr:uncharacterized protein FOA43_002246 [Brettanomyces nanus]QPG74908.1 hypothetical protein FOA43_002246 [Brettanomyces nanus]